MMNEKHQGRLERFREAGLYLVTSQGLSAGRTTPEIVRAALAGGVRLIQLREKDMPLREYIKLAWELRALTSAAGALLIINDRVDVALAVGADGVHLGQEDFPIPEARRLAPDLIIGASTHSIAEAERAQAEGASYINIGPIYPTGTKVWEGEFLGLDGLRSIAAVARVPFSVMGGIKPSHIPDLLKAGAKVIALVTAVTAAENPELATRELLKILVGAPLAEPAGADERLSGKDLIRKPDCHSMERRGFTRRPEPEAAPLQVAGRFSDKIKTETKT